jgi:hypothetical protein
VELSGSPIHGPFVLHLQAAKEGEVPVGMPLGIGLPVCDNRLHVHADSLTWGLQKRSQVFLLAAMSGREIPDPFLGPSGFPPQPRVTPYGRVEKAQGIIVPRTP